MEADEKLVAHGEQLTDQFILRPCRGVDALKQAEGSFDNLERGLCERRPGRLDDSRRERDRRSKRMEEEQPVSTDHANTKLDWVAEQGMSGKVDWSRDASGAGAKKVDLLMASRASMIDFDASSTAT